MRGKSNIQNKDMLTSNMIEKFTKRFENMSQNNGNSKETSKETNQKQAQKESLAKKISNLVYNGDNKLKDLTMGKKVFTEKEEPQIRFYGKQSNEEEDDQNQSFDQIQKQREEPIKNSDQSSEAIRPSRSRTRNLQEQNEVPKTKKQERELKRNQNQLSMQQKQLFYLKVLKQIGELKNTAEKNDILRRRFRQRNPNKPAKSSLEFQGFKMLFDLRKEIENLETKPSQKEISKKIAKKLIIYIQKNIKDRKYKFLLICRIILKGLNLTHYHSTEWLNRLVHQNKHLLKGINLSQYGIGKQEKPSHAPAPIPIPVQKKEASHCKVQVISQSSEQQSSKQQSLPQQQQDVDESYQQVKSQKSKTKSKKMEEKYVQNRELRLLLDAEQPKKQIKKEVHSANKEIKKIQVTPPKINKNIKKQPIKKQIKPKEQSKVEIKKDLLKNQKNQTSSIDLNKNSDSSIVGEDRKQFPEHFMKRIAGKIDKILKGVYKSIIKQQSKQLCLEKQILLQIYQKYSEFQKSKLAQYLNESVAIDHKNYLIPRSGDFYQSQPEHMINQDKFYRSNRRRSVQSYQAPIALNYIPEHKVETNLSEPSAIKLEREEKTKIYEFLKGHLDQYRKIKPTCTTVDIKQQALRIVTSNFDIRRKISQSDLAQWLYEYQQELEVKKYSQNVSNALQHISQAPRWKVQGKQYSETNSQVLKHKTLIDEFAKKIVKYEKN